MNKLKKAISLKIAEYESLFNSCDKGFINNCKFINGFVSKLLKEKASHEEIIQFINNCIKAKKEGHSLLTISKDELLSKYESLFDFEHEFYGKDFKNNYKFIDGAVNRMLKNKETEEYILSFINDCIKFHKESYGLLMLSQDEYFKVIYKKYKGDAIKK